jgi:predicted transcriptional regulator
MATRAVQADAGTLFPQPYNCGEICLVHRPFDVFRPDQTDRQFALTRFAVTLDLQNQIWQHKSHRHHEPLEDSRMGRPPARDLTERELEVMQVFWKQGEATAAQARDWLANSGLDRTYTTIANLVRTLDDQGYLHQVNRERPFVYRPARSYEEVTGRLLGELVQRVFRGSRSQLLYRLVEQRRLTAEERSVLQEFLEEQS